MNCPHCGRDLRDGDRFCPSCGKPVTTPDPKPEQNPD
ncbi:MAG: zinc-ribbon domain-containing protein, partial [Clostridia bacterium]|nr:zinc-ribbon domain-containing protein [Clostridia bacterium]